MRGIIIVLLLGCGSDKLPQCSDAGVSDLSSASCCQLQVEIKRFLDERRGCDASTDCTTAIGACGVAYQCGVAANQTANDPYLSAMTQRWNQNCLLGTCVMCPVVPRGRRYICQVGTCEAVDP